jgi:hypothetical protein
MSLRNFLAQPSDSMWITELLPRPAQQHARRTAKAAAGGTVAAGRLRPSAAAGRGPPPASSAGELGAGGAATPPAPEAPPPPVEAPPAPAPAAAPETPKVTLYDKVRTKRARLSAEAEQLPERLQELEAVRVEMAGCTRRHQLHRRTLLQQRVRELEAEVDDLQSGRRLQDFLQKSAPYMRAYQKQRFCQSRAAEPPASTAEGGQPPGPQADEMPNALKAYLRDIEDELLPLQIQQQDYCKACAAPMQLYTGMALLVCARCGAAEPHLDATVTALPYSDDSYDYSSMTSKRISHWIEWVRTIQGKETVEIPEHILTAIMDKLHADKVPKDKITVQRVRDILKKLRLRKYYEHVQLITSKITGVSPPRLTPAQEEKLKMLFIAASHSFQKYCPESRQNFLSYGYVFSKLAGLMGLHEFEPFCTTLKGHEKLQKADAIFRRICEDRQWPFIQSTPAAD